MRCSFLTMENTEGWSIDAGLCIPHLQALGWEVDWVPWRSPDIDWNSYDMVYPAAPWDYPEDPIEFMQVIERIACSSAMLVNSVELIRWNLTKTYLRDLQARGVGIVPSLWYERFRELDLPACFKQLESGKIIVKPVISASAANTFLLDKPLDAGTGDELNSVFSDRPLVVQPFIENIRSEGEYSLFYIDGVLSHAVRKIPRPGDFRVQEEHGGNIVAVNPEESLRSIGNAVMQQVDPAPVYARVDFVRGPEDEFLLMELELIEPSLYLRMNEGAALRFANALVKHIADFKGSDKIAR